MKKYLKKDKKFRFNFLIIEKYKNLLKFLKNSKINKKKKIFFFLFSNKKFLYKNKINNFCYFSKKTNSIKKNYFLSRIFFKKKISECEISTIKKWSW